MLNEKLSLGIMGESVVDEDVTAVEVTQAVDVDVTCLKQDKHTAVDNLSKSYSQCTLF